MTPRRRLPEPPPRDETAPVVDHVEVAPAHFRLRVEAPYIARHAAPGQFVQVRVGGVDGPFLRRPLSVSMTWSTEGVVELVYRVTGEGTAALARRRGGESLAVLGPLGQPFRLPDSGAVLLVGGGVGMPPLHFAATRSVPERTRVVQGARTKDLLLYRDEFAALGVGTRWATDDGTAGVHGLVTDALGEALAGVEGHVEILACGPTPMMERVADLARRNGIRCQVSLEERMACGFGICMGCAVRVGEERADPEYRLVCVDGPVFDATEVFAPDDSRPT